MAKKSTPAIDAAVDYQHAFALMPVALMISRQRVITACNQAFADMFRCPRAALMGQSMRVLYPNQVDFERFGSRVIPVLSKHGGFTDSRAFKRADGELFWVSVTGASEHRDDPYAEALWMFAELDESPAAAKLSGRRQLDWEARSKMTRRERDVAALLIENQTSKEIAKVLEISPRTVEIYRSRLLRKFGAATTAELLKRLLS
jgi:DNA-binding CsgD family transcriptional regulator